MSYLMKKTAVSVFVLATLAACSGFSGTTPVNDPTDPWEPGRYGCPCR